MKFPVAFQYDGKDCRDFSVREALADHMADVTRLVNKGMTYTGMRKWASSVLEAVDGDEDRVFIDNVVKAMPFVDLYAVVCFGLAETRGEDSVEASYRCPKCGEIRTYSNDGEDDMTDHLSDIEYAQTEEEPLVFKLSKKVQVVDTGNGRILAEAEEIQMRMPTVEDFIRGEQRYPDNEYRLMFFAYGCALEKVNGADVDQTYRNRYGDKLFQRMSSTQINQITRRIYRDQIGGKIERVCLKCHHRWEAPLNLSGFFDTGIQG